MLRDTWYNDSYLMTLAVMCHGTYVPVYTTYIHVFIYACTVCEGDINDALLITECPDGLGSSVVALMTCVVSCGLFDLLVVVRKVATGSLSLQTPGINDTFAANLDVSWLVPHRYVQPHPTDKVTCFLKTFASQ